MIIISFTIFESGTKACATQINSNYDAIYKLQGEKAINDVSATNSGILAGSSQVLIDKFLNATGQNNTVDIYNTNSNYTINNAFICGSSGNGSNVSEVCLSSGGTSGGTNSRGQRILINVTCYIYSITKDAGCTATRAKLLKDNGDVMALANFVSNTATLTNPVILQRGTYYRIEVDNSGSSFILIDSISGLTYPYNRTNVSFVAHSTNGGGGSDTTCAASIGVVTQIPNTAYVDSIVQSVATTIPTGKTKVFVTPLMYEALSTGDSITADVSIDNGSTYTTDVPINEWTEITSANGTQLIVKANLLTGDGSTTPKVSGWRVLLE